MHGMYVKKKKTGHERKHNTEARSFNHCYNVKAVSIEYYDCVFVAFLFLKNFRSLRKLKPTLRE
jgi:hypothetical protein